jgi:hypothetical protein
MGIRTWWQRVTRWQGKRVRMWRLLGAALEAELGSADAHGTSIGQPRTRTHPGAAPGEKRG